MHFNILQALKFRDGAVQGAFMREQHPMWQLCTVQPSDAVDILEVASGLRSNRLAVCAQPSHVRCRD